jgi:hypothetical protein
MSQTQSYSSRTIVYTGFLPTWGRAVLRRNVGQFGVSIYMIALISRMEVTAEGPYKVEHDQSKNLLTYHDLLQRQIDHVNIAEFRQPQLASIRFR